MAFNIEDTFTKGQVLDQLCTDQKTLSLSRGRGKVCLAVWVMPVGHV